MPAHYLSLLAFAAGLAGAAEAPPPERFSDEVTVREATVVVSLPDSLSETRLQTLDPASFQVLEDGRFRTVLTVSPLATWTQVLYFDREAVPAGDLFRAALALGKEAEALTRRGPVTVIVADPEPRVVLDAEREPRLLAEALAQVAGQARIARDRGQDGDRPSAAALVGGVARLLAWVEAAPQSVPVALFWAFPHRLPADVEQTLLPAALTGAADTLARRGWTALPVALAPPLGRLPLWIPTETQLFRENTLDEDPRYLLFRFDLRTRRVQKPLHIAPTSLDPWLLPDFAPMKAVAAATVGLVVTDERQIAGVLDRLGQRLEVVYSSAAAADGPEPITEITLVPEGKPVRFGRPLPP